MAATDKFRKYKSLYSSTSNTFGTGESVTITPASVVGLPTDTEITLTFDRVDSSGTKTPSKMERILGKITGANFVVSSGGRAVEGTEQAHTSPVVEMVFNAYDYNDLIDAHLVGFNQDGTLKNSTVLTTPVINTSVSGTAILDEDNMVSDSATKLATQQSIKAYVDAQAAASLTLTNKRINPRIVTAASYTTDTGTALDVSTCDEFDVTAQAGALKLNNPGGTPVNGQKLIVRIKDNGSPRALTYDTQFRASSDLALPTTTVLGKVLYMGFIWDSTDSKWTLLAVLNNI
jgi:hypothetical protein